MIIETNSALGYNEVAYFIKVKNTEHNFLCINTTEDGYDKTYDIGTVYEFSYEYEYDVVIPSKEEMILNDSPLKDTFLFEYFLVGNS